MSYPPSETHIAEGLLLDAPCERVVAGRHAVDDFVKEVVDLSGAIPFLEPHCGERSRCDGVCADHD